MSQEEQQKLMQIQQQLQTIVMQKETLNTERDGIENALQELEEGGDEEIYRSVGDLLIKRDRDEVVDDLEEEKESLDMKIQSLERKEGQLKEKLQESQDALMGDGSGDGPIAG